MSTIKFLVLHSYKSKKEGELTINVGDLVRITHEGKKGYCYGSIVGKKQKGLFPRCFVERYESSWEMNSPLSEPILKGILSKRRSKLQSWKKRQVKLFPHSLAWYKSTNPEPIGLVLLKDCRKIVKLIPKKKVKYPVFLLQSSVKSWEFRCKSEKDQKVWVTSLLNQIKKFSTRFEYYEAKNYKNLQKVSLVSQSSTHILSRSVSKDSVSTQKKKKPNLLKRSQSLFRLGLNKNTGNNFSNINKNRPLRTKKSFMFTHKKKSKIKDPYETTKRFGVPLIVVVARDKTKIPKIIKLSVDFILSNGLKEVGIFRKSGQQNEILQYKKNIDAGRTITFENEENIHNISGLLKLWFRELPESLLTKELYPEFIDLQEKYEGKELCIKIKKIINQLPELNKNIFQIISNLSCKIATFKSVNKMDLPNLALLFGPTLCSRRGVHSKDIVNMQKECRVISIMFEYYDHIFNNKKFLENQDEKNTKTQNKTNSTNNEIFKVIAIEPHLQTTKENKEKQLFFQDGDIISVLNSDDKEWWYGKLLSVEKNEKNELDIIGYFPSSFVEMINEEEYLTLISQEM
ncbi:rho/rac/cdc gtpase-activating protein [Anaeramoeba flamelloides]|uniref:Rho/rac/cdc gtpase-activating protein n=1 Tax=Anaeramoeba flamelloides TaxID=1746091 RepID=A0ABQ8ZED1_9EUKA|nr:rho/rac/cdc gtpase-activating protein [Anaeramoeba flamelloides]